MRRLASLGIVTMLAVAIGNAQQQPAPPLPPGPSEAQQTAPPQPAQTPPPGQRGQAMPGQGRQGQQGRGQTPPPGPNAPVAPNAAAAPRAAVHLAEHQGGHRDLRLDHRRSSGQEERQPDRARRPLRSDRSTGGNSIINIDAAPTVRPDGRIYLHLTLEYQPELSQQQNEQMKGTGPSRITMFSESLSLVVADGKPLVASQSADPRSERRVSVEITATIPEIASAIGESAIGKWQRN